MKSLAARTLAKYFIMGATFMAFGPVGVVMDTRGNVAAAQGAMSSKEGSELLKKLDEPIKKTLEFFELQKKSPGNAAQTVGFQWSNATLRNLWLDALRPFNTRLGKSVFDLTGAEPKDQFISLTKQLNTLLNRPENPIFDNASIEQVKKMATRAVGDATSSGPLAAALAGVAAGSAQAQGQEEKPAVVATPGPVKGGAVPKKQDEAGTQQKTGQPNQEETKTPELTDAKRDAYQTTIETLNTISKPKTELGAAATSAQRADASNKAAAMQTLLNKKKPTGADLETLAKKNTEAQALIDAVQSKVARKEANVPQGLLVSINAEVDSIKQSLRTYTGQTADSIRAMADNTIYCGDTAARLIIKNLKAARDSLVNKDEKAAQKGVTDAKSTFETEQASIRKAARFIIDFNRKNSEIARTSGLADKDALLAAETADHIPTTVKEAKATNPEADAKTVENKRYYHTSKRGDTILHNSSDEVAAEWNSRAGIVENYLSRDKVSYYYVASHLFPMRYDARSVKLLSDGFAFVKSHGLDSADIGKRTTFWTTYSALTIVMRDPNFDVFVLLPAFDQKDLIEEKRRAMAMQFPGRVFKKSELERLARQDLRQNYSKKLAITTQNFINNVIQFSSEPSGTRSALSDSWAALRSQRAICETEYQNYFDGLVEKYDKDKKEKRYLTLLDKDQRYRILQISEKLKSAMSIATLAKDDPVMQTAQKWVSWIETNRNHIQNPDDETIKIPQMVAAADSIYQMTVGILALSEATMFLNNPEMRSSSLTASSEAVKNAKKTIDDAKRIFVLNFQEPDFKPTYYPLITRKMADDAINMLAPASHRTTDDLAYFSEMTLYNNFKVVPEETPILSAKDASSFKAAMEKNKMDPSIITESQIAAMGNLEEGKALYLHIGTKSYTVKKEKDKLNMYAPETATDFDKAGFEQSNEFAKRYFMMWTDNRENAGFGVPALFGSGAKYQGWDYALSIASFETGRATSNSANLFLGHRRPTDSRTDEHKTVTVDAKNAELAQRAPWQDWHEELDQAYFGSMWVEHERELRVFMDTQAPAILRQQRYNPFQAYDSYVSTTTLGFGALSAEQAILGVNASSSSIVKGWVTWGNQTVDELVKKFGCKDKDELMKRLNMVSVNDHPEVKYVFRGLEMLGKATEYSGQMNGAPSGNYLNGMTSRAAPHTTIELVQVAMADLTDPELDKLVLPPIPVPQVVSGIKYYAKSHKDKYTEGGMHLASFKVSDITGTANADNKSTTFTLFDRWVKSGMPDMVIDSYGGAFHDLRKTYGIRGESGIYLLHPDDLREKDRSKRRYTATIIRDAQVVNAQGQAVATGQDIVVKVKPGTLEPMAQANGTVRDTDVVALLDKGTFEVKLDTKLSSDAFNASHKALFVPISVLWTRTKYNNWVAAGRTYTENGIHYPMLDFTDVHSHASIVVKPVSTGQSP